MDLSLLWFLVIGLLAGYIAGRLTKGSGFGVAGDLVIGVVGALIGGFLFRLLGFAAYGLIAQLFMAIIGALILLKLIGHFRHQTP